MDEELVPGARVRVKPDCPHTMPHYARVLIGRVHEVLPNGQLEVVFGEHSFPIDPKWLLRVEDPEATVETTLDLDDEGE
jgi:hypothetical protein